MKGEKASMKKNESVQKRGKGIRKCSFSKLWADAFIGKRRTWG